MIIQITIIICNINNDDTGVIYDDELRAKVIIIMIKIAMTIIVLK